MDKDEATARLEQDMRRYVYDKTPDRRIKCLDQYRERLGLESWAEAENQRVNDALARYEGDHGDA
jgi:hypothetical protein